MTENDTQSGGLSLRDLADEQPWDFYRHLQETGAIWDEELNRLLVGSYELVHAVLRRDERDFRRPKGKQVLEDPQLARITRSPRDITVLYGDDHDRFHRWWRTALSRENCTRWSPTRIQPVVQAVLNRFAGRGSAELRSEFALQVPIRVIASVLGLPWQDDEWIESCSAFVETKAEYRDALLDPPENVREIGRNAVSKADEFANRVMPFAERALAGKDLDDDLISMYAVDGPSIFPDWGIEDMLAGILTTFFAGSDTTTYAACNGLYLMLTTDGLQDELRSGGDRAVWAFVEEALRILGVAHFQNLDVVNDTEIGGVKVKRGDTVVPVVGAANLDPKHYECPYDVKLDRAHPRDHSTFWLGKRVCGGMWLARTELYEMFRATIDRLSDLRLDDAGEPPRLHGWKSRSYWPLNVRFDGKEQPS